jgi:pimeloyl-ACP methyl ester carboxylesterase
MGMLTGPAAGRFHVIAAGNRGTSRSAKPPGPYSIEQPAADLAGLMNRLDLPCSRLLGIWMSGRIAMALALAQPGRVNEGQACRSPTGLHVPVPSPRLIMRPVTPGCAAA